MNNYNFSVNLLDYASRKLKDLQGVVTTTNDKFKALSAQSINPKINPNFAQKINSLKDKTVQVTAVFKDNVTNKIDAIGNKIKSIRVEANATPSLRSLQKELSNLEKTRSFEVNIENIAKINEQIRDIERKINRIENVSPRGLKAGFQAQKNQDLDFLNGGGLQTVAMGTTIAGAYAMQQAFTMGIKSAAEMSDKMAGVAKTTGMTNGEVTALRTQLEGLDTRTKLVDLLGMGRVAGQMGIAESEINDFIGMTDQMSVAFNDEYKSAEEVADVFGKLSNIFSRSEVFQNDKTADRMSKLGSAMNDLAAKGASTVKNLADFAIRVAPSMSNMNPQTILAIGAGFEEMGLNSEIGASGLRTFFKEAYQNTDIFAKAMGMNKKAVMEMLNTDEGTKKFLANFSSLFKGRSISEQKTALMNFEINDQQAQDAILNLIALQNKGADNTSKYSNRLQELYDISETALKENTSLQKEADIINKTFAANIEKAQKKIDSLFLKIGEKYKTFVNPFLESFNSNYFDSSKIDSTTNAYVGLSAGLAAAGTAYGVYRVATLAAAAGQWVLNGGLLTTVGTVGLVVAGIGLVVGGLVYAYNEFEGFRTVVDTTFEALKSGWESASEIFSSLWTQIKDTSDAFMNLGENIKSTFGFGDGVPTWKKLEDAQKNQGGGVLIDKRFEANKGQLAALGVPSLGMVMPQNVIQETKTTTKDKKTTEKAPEKNVLDKAQDLLNSGGNKLNDWLFADKIDKRKGKKDKSDIDIMKGSEAIVGSGPKTNNFYINIGKQVETLNINTTNMGESASEIRNKIESVFLEIVNGIQAKTAQ